MPGWVGNIEQETIANETFRTVVCTGGHTQLAVMSIEPGDDIRRRRSATVTTSSCASRRAARAWSWAAPRARPTRCTRSRTTGR